MSGIAAISGRAERRTARRLSAWTRGYLPRVTFADLGCAAVGVVMAAQIRFGGNLTPMSLVGPADSGKDDLGAPARVWSILMTLGSELQKITGFRSKGSMTE